MDDDEKRAPPVLPPAAGIPAVDANRDFNETAGSDLVYTKSLRASENLSPSNASALPVRGEKKSKAATRALRAQEIGIEAMDFFEKEQAKFHAESLEIIDLTGRGETRLYLFLQRCFEFVQDERFDLAKFEIFCRFKKLTCTKATKKNQYLCAIRGIHPV